MPATLRYGMTCWVSSGQKQGLVGKGSSNWLCSTHGYTLF